MNFLSDVITYFRRIVKTMQDDELSNNLIIDYINRFWLMDVDARIQLFDLKTSYEFQTVPGVDKYNIPLYDVQGPPGNQNIGMFPVYQGFEGPAYINGLEVPFYTQKSNFYRLWPQVPITQSVVATGTNSVGPYSIQIPFLGGSAPLNPPFNGILRGHVDMAGIMATGNNVDPPVGTAVNPLIPSTSIASRVFFTATDANNANVVVQDSGQFLNSDNNQGLLMSKGTDPYNYTGGLGTINYVTGDATVTFPVAIPTGVQINAQVYFQNSGIPRGVLFHNNVITLKNVPSQQWLVQLQGYLSPAAFLSTSDALPYAYMAEYIARGAARKLLSDTGDVEQFNFYEPLFKEQEMLVWKRSQRQTTATRTQTIYSQRGIGYQNSYPGQI